MLTSSFRRSVFALAIVVLTIDLAQAFGYVGTASESPQEVVPDVGKLLEKMKRLDDNVTALLDKITAMDETVTVLREKITAVRTQCQCECPASVLERFPLAD